MNELIEGEMDGTVINQGSLYDYFGASEIEIDFNFEHDVAANRFREIEYFLNIILDNLKLVNSDNRENESEIKQLKNFSIYLYSIYQILKVYVEYRYDLYMHKNFILNDDNKENKDSAFDFYKIRAVEKIEDIEYTTFETLKKNKGFIWDISMLAKNFFYSRLSAKNEKRKLGNL